MKKITSLQNEKIKYTQTLYKRKKREAAGIFLAEGVRLAEMALASSNKIEYAFLREKAMENPRLADVVSRLIEKKVDVYDLPTSLFQKITGTVTSQGILLAVCEQKCRLENLLQTEASPFWVVLDGVQDPGNAGSILRTAEAAGAKGAIFLQGSMDAYSDKVVRSSMGAIFTLPIVTQVERAKLIEMCKARGIRLLVTLLDNEATPYTQVDYHAPLALVLGNEGAGVSAELTAAADEKIYIPIYGKAESLNVAAAAAILSYRSAEVHASTM
ncbi:RNA methyltransferase [Selenomonas sp. TAMA-11512]|uniref:TrmH family RNA methyltransferase n=1 Tax=Selenomonas sp. TAMA-11512 TaxID=3095337 RepID=UPI003093BE11|nr:RNA methyltransferase [Selenomonas sp. TAMA-11512]